MKKYLFVWVVLFSFSFGASAEEEAVAPQEMLPEYYPKYSPEKGGSMKLISETKYSK